MKILNLIIEILTSPFSILLKLSGSGKNYFSSFAKPLIIFLISILIVIALVLFFYRMELFQS